MPPLLPLLRLMRPHQWLKNGFVFAGLVFGYRWSDPAMLRAVALAFGAFCCASSAIYVLNDWLDRTRDAAHPSKFSRPLASGVVSGSAASVLGIALVLACVGLALAASSGPMLLVLLGLYALFNLAYSWRLKSVAVVDVFVIASGFMLRLLAGTVAVGITPSRWMLLTGVFVALFLGFAKRKAESFHAPQAQRSVMAGYPPALLDTFVAAMLTATLTTYSLFATSAEALRQHGERLVYTVPVVIFAMLRYTWQVHHGKGEDVARDLLADPWILFAALLWLLLFLGRSPAGFAA
jgi:decaprenyl-phosphate phosphoribosyltransferase